MGALNPAQASDYYDEFVKVLDELTGRKTETGIFGADMKVELLNDGPVTVMLDSADIVKNK